MSLASLDQENKLVFVPRERNPFIERIEYDQRRVRLIHDKLKSMNEVTPAIKKAGIHVPISGIVNQKSFKKVAKKLSLAPKYIDQLIYGKSGVVDNNGNVNLLKLGVVDVKQASPLKWGGGRNQSRNLPRISKLADTSRIDSFRATSMPNLHQPLDDTTKRKIKSPPWKSGIASARWGEEHYRSTSDLTSGQKGTSFYSPNAFKRNMPLESDIDTYKKHERMEHQKAQYANCEMSLNQRRKDTMLQKKLYERHMKTVKKQAQRYDDFLAAERIKRATLWTDSGKLIDENAPLRLNHRKHQYKQQIDDGSYRNAMSRRNGLTRMEWHKVFGKRGRIIMFIEHKYNNKASSWYDMMSMQCKIIIILMW